MPSTSASVEAHCYAAHTVGCDTFGTCIHGTIGVNVRVVFDANLRGLSAPRIACVTWLWHSL